MLSEVIERFRPRKENFERVEHRACGKRSKGLHPFEGSFDERHFRLTLC